jgi:alkanesulfonate monooxygenase SsuD/methylene tetrahydromethanopterin reductase-like flavin-dependent oxidoreductase (luciferase family)
VKVCMFHLMPYRDLPADFDQRYKSAYIDPVWFDVADPDKVGQYFNWTLDEMVHAARASMHGLCTNQHHQNVYGFMANPSLMGSALAKLTNGLNVAIIQIGSTLPSTSPPTRIAEEYLLIDCLSGGRLVAGFPTGLPTDATISNGVVPVEQRERYREALQLVLKAWQAREVFAWNGRHYQLPMVNLWPRPIQQPHPPIWIPGSGSATTVEFVVDRDDCFCHLSYLGAKNAETLGDYYWHTVARHGRDANPYRLGFLQLIGFPRPTRRPKNTRRTSNTSFASCSTPPSITRRYPVTRTTRAWSGGCGRPCASASTCGRSTTRISSSAAF